MTTNYWITNISKTDINLSDLNLIIRSNTSLDLLRSKSITLSQIEKSIESGSIYKRRDKIVFGKPQKVEEQQLKLSSLPRKCRSKNNAVNVVEPIDQFVTEEDPLAADLSDSAEADRKPIFKK